MNCSALFAHCPFQCPFSGALVVLLCSRLKSVTAVWKTVCQIWFADMFYLVLKVLEMFMVVANNKNITFYFENLNVWLCLWWGKELAARGGRFPVVVIFRAAPLGEARPRSTWLALSRALPSFVNPLNPLVFVPLSLQLLFSMLHAPGSYLGSLLLSPHGLPEQLCSHQSQKPDGGGLFAILSNFFFSSVVMLAF